MPSSIRWLMAPLGQAAAQGAWTQWRQATEEKVRVTAGKVPCVTSITWRSLTVPALISCHCRQAI
jgi:hypothetical protein